MNIKVSREDLLKQLGYKDPPQPRLLDMVLEVLGLLGGLVEPMQAFRQIQDEKDLPAFLSGAVLKYAGAVTLGPKLEDRVKDLFERGKPAEAYILDIAGSIAVTKAGNTLWNEIRQDAAAKGFKRGLRRTPGCRGIDLETQKWVFEKLADIDLGIELTSSYMMSPRKSVSFLARFGGKLKGSFSCKGCPQHSDCSLRFLSEKQPSRCTWRTFTLRYRRVNEPFMLRYLSMNGVLVARLESLVNTFLEDEHACALGIS